MSAFRANPASTVNLAVTAANGQVALKNPAKGRFQIRVVNAGAKTAFVRLAPDAAGVADITNDVPVLAGTVEVLTVDGDNITTPITNVAAICAAAEATTLYFTTGFGD